MSYTPTEWKTGDVITADKLNNMESGILNSGKVFIINATGVATKSNTSTMPTLDKTFSEILSEVEAGKQCLVAETTDFNVYFFEMIDASKFPDTGIYSFTFERVYVQILSDNKMAIERTTVTVGKDNPSLSTYSSITVAGTT